MLVPSVEGGESLAWASIEAEWQLPFPEHYKRFIDTFGTGEMRGFLALLAPYPKGHEAPEGYRTHAEISPEYAEGTACPFPVYPAPGGLFPLGSTAAGDDLSTGRLSGWRRGGS